MEIIPVQQNHLVGAVIQLFGQCDSGKAPPDDHHPGLLTVRQAYLLICFTGFHKGLILV